ncbi:tetratricopeptide repeat protein [Flavobacterium pectinovorum]|uniref:Tetratricopeptide repeat protein n=1 Tax=Flavobacterium pectinovorum TaxID=29533 RepID=A0A502E4I7_9FLAO|nr:tetratricopeptide repeat protein [Flavobacterium pectinovorum]TPG32625.1 tetratricopeptide repeat protein [Flavobacterium pectinovorum]
MNRFKVFFVVVLVLFSFKSFACLNGDTKLLKNGVVLYYDEHKSIPIGHTFNVENFPKLIQDLEYQYKKTNDIDYLSDKGYVLIISGKYQEALKLYLEIEKLKPNRYSTASNLGTLYELMGENQKAYDWIKKSIKLNPESHKGSEWLHLKILEAKIKNLKDVSGAFLINTSFGSETIPKTKLSKKELEELEHALYYQLNERVTFIKPKDQIISVLLFELGNIALLNKDYLSTSDIYQFSKKYGFQNELINNRIVLCYENWLRYYGNENEKLLMEKGGSFRLEGHQIDTVVISLIIVSVLFLGLLIYCIFLFRKLKKIALVSNP